MGYKFLEQPDAPFNLYEEPIKGFRYTIGIDTATGLAKDWSVMQVITNQLPFEQVCVFRSKWPLLEVAKTANDLGRWYNDAMIICETNYPGNAVQDALIQIYRYPKNYQAEEHLDEDPDVSCKFGFKTTQASKWLLIREFQEALDTKSIILNDATTVDEIGNYVYIEDKTKTGAAVGLNDDCVMSLMFAYHAAKLWPQAKKKKPPKDIHGAALQARNALNRFTERIMKTRNKPVLVPV